MLFVQTSPRSSGLGIMRYARLDVELPLVPAILRLNWVEMIRDGVENLLWYYFLKSVEVLSFDWVYNVHGLSVVGEMLLSSHATPWRGSKTNDYVKLYNNQ